MKVRGGFLQRPRQLLQRRISIHLQRVELIFRAFGDQLLAPKLDLCLGFHAQAAHLVVEAVDRGLHFL